MGCEDGLGFSTRKNGREDFVTKVSGSLLYGFPRARDPLRNADSMCLKWNVYARAKLLDKGLIGVGLLAPEAVVDVDGGDAYAKGLAGGGVGGEERE
jgi:hypothetical protein